MIKRSIYLPKNKSFFLFGPRQTGKSTLLHSIFSEETSYWYDFLKSETFTRLAAYPHLFREEVLARGKKITHIIVDEVQRIPEILNEVHWLIERPNAPYFVLTGSSARKLKRSRANLLAGRALNYQLFPLTSSELGEKFSFQKALQLGTLPSVYLEEAQEEAIDRLRAYVSTYLQEEIEAEANLRNLGSFIRFLSLAADENGQQIHYSRLAQITGVSYQSVKAYFEILEDTLIGQCIYPYAKTVRKRISKHPKFYFFDTGVVRALTQKLTVPLNPHTFEFGKAFEHFFVLEIMREAHYQKKDYTFSFYRTNSGAEVDLIIETPFGKTFALEIKAAENITSSHLTGLKSFLEICPDAKLYCACLEPHRRTIGNVTVLPWQEALEEIM
ncbi:ATP-binding protein [Candidatus Peregrinibacteria bacterium]|nr:ATP-binding protein [Candidatus Peregrinibacteria bacterium]